MFESLIFNRARSLLWSALPVLALATAIWFWGERIAIDGRPLLATPQQRVWVIVLVLVAWLLFWGGRWLIGRINIRVERRDTPNQDASTPEGLEAQQLEALKLGYQPIRRLLKRGSVRALPRYLLLGAAASGKTALLQQSGLRIEHSHGDANCSWLLGEQAVLIEASCALVPAAWQLLMRQLARARRSRPLNGVLVALDLPRLTTLSADALAAEANGLHERLDRLQRRFGYGVPVYVLITQCDHLAGFNAFFAGMTEEQRRQVWGMTLPLPSSDRTRTVLDGFSAEFSVLVTQLYRQVADRLYALPSVDERAQAMNFPLQFAALQPRLESFLRQLFCYSRYRPDRVLRGVYFTSAEQHGTATRQWCGELAPTLAPVELRIPEARRAYFIASLLRQVVFAEAHLAPRSRLTPAQRRLLGFAVVGIPVLIGLWCATGVMSRYQQQRAALTQSIRAVDQLAELAARGIQADDPAGMLPLLDAARAISLHAEAPPWPLALTWRAQAVRLNAQAGDQYRQMLHRTLLPYMLRRLGGAMDDDRQDFGERFRALSVYLMLGDHRRLAPDAVLAWLDKDLIRSHASDAARSSLLAHSRSWLIHEQRMGNAELDQALIQRTRDALLAMPLATRLFQRLQSDLARDMSGQLSLSELAGPGTALVLTRASGLPLSEGVPNAYTLAGYQRYLALRDALLARGDKLHWVLADRLRPEDIVANKEALDALYFSQYIKRWDALLADVSLKSARDLNDGGASLKLLSGANSPLSLLLLSAAKQTTLGVGNPVDAHFAELHELTRAAPDGKTSPLNILQGQLAEAAVYLDAVKSARAYGLPPPKQDAMRQLQRSADAQSGALGRMLQGLVTSKVSLNLAQVRRQLNQQWQNQVAGFCRLALTGRYPFDSQSAVDVSREDFSKLFRPNGLIDTFFQKNLAEQVDTSRTPWRVYDPTSLQLTAPALIMFQRAAEIRDAFFPDGGSTPSAGFDLQVTSLDAGVARVALNLNGQAFSYAHGPSLTGSFRWPGQTSGVRVDFIPADGGNVVEMAFPGLWGLWRLFDQAKVRTMRVDQYQIELGAQNRHAKLLLNAQSVDNPFNRGLVRGFACSTSL
ncbi:type VI secretion system membrane subunit TssM [Paludibacterium purpuratum]|uniref:Type VI secretion system protein ImpL n=1 Tax=Paludibacterium purpuratum TaxID=1144873 RepID=A0A4R7B3M1_9NEIS|nr:type VI secretion system membrane subunit TssM [Paludibacterium purpuratum]TDR78369.1 type VI secretion system protein ImpL [Paludibacterium purpuratum]